MKDYLERACEYLGVDKGSVINPRIQGDDYVLIVDKGIKGCPKYYIPLHQLDKPEPEQLPKPTTLDMSYRELQELAKEAGIQANQKAALLRAALWPSDEEE